MSLRLEWSNRKAAEYAVKRWHYTHKMPAGRAMVISVYENEKWIGCVVFWALRFY